MLELIDKEERQFLEHKCECKYWTRSDGKTICARYNVVPPKPKGCIYESLICFEREQINEVRN